MHRLAWNAGVGYKLRPLLSRRPPTPAPLAENARLLCMKWLWRVWYEVARPRATAVRHLDWPVGSYKMCQSPPPPPPTAIISADASTWMQLALVLARGRKIWKARRDDRSTRAFPFAFVSKFQDILIVLIVSFSQFVMKRITYGQGGLILSCSGLFRYLYHVITSLRCMKDKK